jgi:hypothetical protein
VKRATLIRKLRKAIGPGWTIVERGQSTLFFARGFHAHKRAVAEVSRVFGAEPKLRSFTSHCYTLDWKVGKWPIKMAQYVRGTNNYVDVPYDLTSTPLSKQ